MTSFRDPAPGFYKCLGIPLSITALTYLLGPRPGLFGLGTPTGPVWLGLGCIWLLTGLALSSLVLEISLEPGWVHTRLATFQGLLTLTRSRQALGEDAQLRLTGPDGDLQLLPGPGQFLVLRSAGATTPEQARLLSEQLGLTLNEPCEG